MKSSFKQCAMAGCVSVMVSGCAAQQNAAPEYRLSSSAPMAVPGSSMLQRGRAQLDASLDALAIESFRSEIRQNPESADAYNGLAVAYGRIGRNDLAQRYFETALAKDPANIKAQTNLAKLTGDAVPAVLLAAIEMPAAAIEPVAVTKAGENDPIGQVIESLELPALAQLPQSGQFYARSEEGLAKQGVLSTQFAVAPARIAAKSAAPFDKRMPIPENPAQPPAPPPPYLPPATLLSEHQPAGARLERISLGEVRLITRSNPPARLSERRREFDTFGDRLAVWLPHSVAAEQVGRSRGVIEGASILAAIERAERRQKLASAGEASSNVFPEFAYLFFDDSSETANV